MNQRKTLNEVFTPDNGIFSNLQDCDVPWKDDNIALILDYEYHYNIAGTRFVSPLVINMLADDETLSTLARESIAEIVFSLCGLRWTKLWDTLSFEYNPINNYDMVEQMTNERTQITYGKTDTLTHNTSEGETVNLTDTRTPNITNTNTSEVQGFNSNAYAPSERNVNAETGTEGTTHTGTDTKTRTGTEANVQGGSDVHTHEYRLTRSGNIGVTTSQQMIESERNLWKWQFFYDVVFPDVNRVLTLSIY